MAFVAYIVTQFIVLLVSRYREYWADRFSGKVTKKPNALSTALAKIAYGLASEGKGSDKVKQINYENALMISDPRSARALAFNVESLKAKDNFTVEDIKEAIAWDMWNPWAKWLELQCSHPIPAKRIMARDKMAEDLGQKPAIGFDLVQPESFWDEFLGDIVVTYFWLLAFPVGIFVMINIGILAGLGTILAIVGFSLTLFILYYYYPMGFRPSNVEFCIDDPKASPIRGTPVQLEGHIIGRGNPGLFFNEDLKLDDGSGIILMDWHHVLKLVVVLEGIFRTKKKIGKRVRVRGWYRRNITPYVEIYTIDWEDNYQKMRTRPVYIGASMFLCILGLFLQLVAPVSIIFTIMPLLLLFLVLYGLKIKYHSWTIKRESSGPHPYWHLSSIADAVVKYHLLAFCEPKDSSDELGNAIVDNSNHRCMQVRCPKCGEVQEVKLLGKITQHACTNCAVSGVVRIA